MKRAEYQEAMRALDLVIAVGTSTCKMAGHCAWYDPAKIAFMLRNDDPAFVYIAAPLPGGIIKVGFSQNPAQRMQTLSYGVCGLCRLIPGRDDFFAGVGHRLQVDSRLGQVAIAIDRFGNTCLP
ncbi:hypothetical protein [Caballeronia sordidicola]|uniref:hypothetical protein n=1 Tax=Caballeronia sordidicola TaxID=196367 RepID=UPI00094C2C77|nr:hypothetical protein [Caballeronia sordidicola]